MKSFRDVIQYLEGQDRLQHVKKEVDPEYELVAAAIEIYKQLGKAALFENVKGSSFPVVSHILADRSVVALSLNMDPALLTHQWSEREAHKSHCDTVSEGPCQEVVRLDPDLNELPLCIHSTGDAGRYLTGGAVLALHPIGLRHNASYNRCQLAGKDKLRIRMMPPQHLGLCQQAAEERDQALACAIVVGAPPSLMFSAASKIPFERDELEFAGALSGVPLEVVKCKTNNVLVPANAEMVIEGRVLPHVREIEGPFGEFTDTVVPANHNHVFQVDAITHRKDAYFHDIYPANDEDMNLLSLPIESEIFNHIRKYARVEDIKEVLARPFVFGAFIKIKKQSDMQVRSIVASALTSYAWTQFVVVVDDDVNIHDANDVIWAIQTRCSPDTGVISLPGIGSYTREDIVDENIGKFGIDATVPMNKRDIYKRRQNPYYGKIKLDYYTK